MTATTEPAQVVTSAARALIRCQSKTCRRAHVAEFATTSRTVAYDGRPVTTRTVAWNGRDRQYRDRYDLARIIGEHFRCAGCGGQFASFDLVAGRFAEAVRCGVKCRAAVGPNCDCQCAGQNHGSDHTRWAA